MSANRARKTPPVGRRFAKGQSGNPGGRPKGIASQVKALVGDNGEKLAELLWLYASGTDAQIRKRFGCKYGPRHEARLEAMKELLDRGFGRPAQTVALEDGNGQPVKFTLQLGGDRGASA